MKYGKFFLSAAIAFSLSACRNQDGDKTHDDEISDITHMDTAAGTGAGGTIPASRDSGEGATNTLQTQTMMNDSNIFAHLDMSNTQEIEEAKIAVKMSKDKAVKSFAQMLVTHHTKMKNDGAKLARKLAITPKAGADSTQMRMMADANRQRLNGLDKNSFDMEFVRMQIDNHQRTLDNLNRMEGMAQNAELKALIQTAKPQVQEHLDKARQLQTQLSTASTGTAGNTSGMTSANGGSTSGSTTAH